MTKPKCKTITCRCLAYSFPHRWKGGKCFARVPRQFTFTLEEELEQQEWEDKQADRIIVKPAPEFEYDD